MRMDREEAEIYSYEPNRVVLRVPWRRYPGALIQGDELSTLSAQADRACAALFKRLCRDELDEQEVRALSGLVSLRDELREVLRHYKRVTKGFEPGSPSSSSNSFRAHDARHIAATRALKKRHSPKPD